jgi:hypothetical protein
MTTQTNTPKIEVNISLTPPPNMLEITKAFGVKWGGDTVFTYGDTIHSNTTDLPANLIIHEMVHMKQQREFEGGVEAWWEKYLVDEDFRLQEELLAYRTQYQYLIATMIKYPREIYKMLEFFGKSLASNTYRLKNMNKWKAMLLIKNLKE